MAERKVTTKAELLRLIDQAADEGWTELDLAGLGLEELPAEIGKLESLETLRLGYFDYQGFGNYASNNFRSIPSPIFELQSLKVLEISFNPITEISPEISNLRCLERLEIGSAQINTFPESFCNLPSLLELVLGNTWITSDNEGTLWAGGNSIESLPESIEKLKKLKKSI